MLRILFIALPASTTGVTGGFTFRAAFFTGAGLGFALQERSENRPTEQSIGPTYQVTAGPLRLIRRGVFITPMPKNAGKKRRLHI
jgi:hypothetical protein